MQRKLTAILSADVVGFSGLMEADEVGTLERLKANRSRIFDPSVAAHGGRLVKLMGDGALVEFASAVAAVNCALAIQEATARAEPDSPEAKRIHYRIGVNLGDVIVDDDDLYGDGINVAVRLQTLASVGGIALAGTVRDHVEGKVSCTFEDMGKHSVKNIERPIHVFSVGAAIRGSSSASKAQTSRRLSICVLPFANMSGEPEQEYFSDGITEDIITDLSKVSALFVVSRNSAFTFKGKHVDVLQIARQLKVSHVLEGSVRKSGGRVRITAQLIDGATNGHLWAERYDRDLNDIFALQDEISAAIVAALKLTLLPEEKKAIEQRGTNSIDAYNLYLMARNYAMTGSRSSVHRYQAIVRLCRRAIDIDPFYASAWALMATAQGSLRASFGGGDGGQAASERALGLDPNLAEAHAANARAAIANGQFDKARGEIDLALTLDAESYDVNYVAALVSFAQRNLADAVRFWEKSASLVETDYLSAGMLMTCRTAQGDEAGARDWAKETLARAETIVAREPDNGTAMGFVVLALAGLGEIARAKDVAARAVIIDPDNLIMRYNMARTFVTNFHDHDTALDLLDPLFEKLDRGALNWVKIEPDFDPIRDHERFKTMFAKAEARLAAE